MFVFHFFLRNTVDGDSRWCCTYLLNPSDPLFIDIGEAFIKQQIEGTPDAIMFLSIALAIHLKAIFIKPGTY